MLLQRLQMIKASEAENRPKQRSKSIIMEMFDSGTGVNQITREIGLNKFAVSRITRNPSEALAKVD